MSLFNIADGKVHEMHENDSSSYRSSVNAVQYLKRRLSPDQSIVNKSPEKKESGKTKPPKTKPLNGIQGT